VSPPGLILSGLLADRLLRRGIPRKRVSAGSLGLMSLAVAGMAWVIAAHGPAWLLAALMLVASFFMWGFWSPAYALLAETFPPVVLGRAFGAYNMVCMTGAIISPYASGALRDWSGSFVPALLGAAVLSWASIALVLRVGTTRTPRPVNA